MRSTPVKRNNSCWIELSSNTQQRVRMRKGGNITARICTKSKESESCKKCNSKQQQLVEMTQFNHTNVKWLTVLHLWTDPQASSTSAHRQKHLLHYCQILCTKVPLNLPSSQFKRVPTLYLWVCTHTHVSKVEEGQCFSFYIISSPPSFAYSPSPLPLLTSLAFLAQSVSSIHLPPTPLSQVDAGSLQCSEHVQHQEHASEYWLTAGDLTNGKRGTAVMSPLHGQWSLRKTDLFEGVCRWVCANCWLILQAETQWKERGKIWTKGKDDERDSRLPNTRE